MRFNYEHHTYIEVAKQCVPSEALKLFPKPCTALTVKIFDNGFLPRMKQVFENE